MRSNGDAVEHLLAHYVVDGVTGCWLWAGRKDAIGYGDFRASGKRYKAHRLSFQFFKGPIPAGMGVCHSCDIPACINPQHLFAGSQLDNMRDAAAKGRVRNQNSGKTVCDKGHPLTPENTIRQMFRGKPNGRGCRECSRARWREYAARTRERLLAARRARYVPAQSDFQRAGEQRPARRVEER